VITEDALHVLLERLERKADEINDLRSHVREAENEKRAAVVDRDHYADALRDLQQEHDKLAASLKNARERAATLESDHRNLEMKLEGYWRSLKEHREAIERSRKTRIKPDLPELPPNFNADEPIPF
jgi:chromosome segregation ATPase